MASLSQTRKNDIKCLINCAGVKSYIERVVYHTYLKEYGDAEVHERLCEVDNAFPGVVNGHGANSKVCLLLHRRQANNEL